MQANPNITAGTVVHQLADHRVIIENAPGITLPDPPTIVVKPRPEPASAERIAEAAAKWNAYRTSNPTIHAGAAIYKMPDGCSITHVSNFRVNNGSMISFWSSADFSLFAHRIHFDCPAADEDKKYTMLLFWSQHDVARLAEHAARRGRPSPLPAFPTFAEGSATWIIDETRTIEKPDSATIRAIADLHGYYQQNLDTIKTESTKLAAEREARRAALEANPPQPRDIHLRVSRLDPAQTEAWHKYAVASTPCHAEVQPRDGGAK